METGIAALEIQDGLSLAGFRFGEQGTHTSRTIMFQELTDLLEAVPANGAREAYATAIVEENALGKETASTRRLTNQRLGELYGLDPRMPLFRVLRKLWTIDKTGRPLLALLCSLARDPLLRCTSQTVLQLPVGAELIRTNLLETIHNCVGSRLNDSTLDKVARNTGSSWTQSGHLTGRVRKIRQRVTPTPGSVAYALWMGSLEGLAGKSLLSCRWVEIFDRRGDELIELVLQAKQLGLLHARIGGGVIEIDATRLDGVPIGG